MTGGRIGPGSRSRMLSSPRVSIHFCATCSPACSTRSRSGPSRRVPDPPAVALPAVPPSPPGRAAGRSPCRSPKTCAGEGAWPPAAAWPACPAPPAAAAASGTAVAVPVIAAAPASPVTPVTPVTPAIPAIPVTPARLAGLAALPARGRGRRSRADRADLADLAYLAGGLGPAEVRLDERSFQHLDRVGLPDQPLGLVGAIRRLHAPQVDPHSVGLSRLHRRDHVLVPGDQDRVGDRPVPGECLHVGTDLGVHPLLLATGVQVAKAQLDQRHRGDHPLVDGGHPVPSRVVPVHPEKLASDLVAGVLFERLDQL